MGSKKFILLFSLFLGMFENFYIKNKKNNSQNITSIEKLNRNQQGVQSTYNLHKSKN